MDLLKFDESSMSKYVTKLMDIMYTKQEIHDGLVIEGKTNSKRTPLDMDKYNIIKGN